MVSPSSVESHRLRVWRRSARNGARFLAARQDANGAFAEAASLIVCHYKAPSAFFRTGYVASAAAGLNYVKRTFVAEDWTLDLGGDSDSYLHDFAPYPYGWLAAAALLLGSPADARGFYSRMIRFKRDGGGVHAGDAPGSRICLGMTAWLGLTAQLLGDDATAREQASFITEQLARQDDMEHRFLTALDASNAFITQPPEGKTWHEVSVSAQPGTYHWYWLVALCAVFLAKQYELVGGPRTLEAAESCFAFLERSGDAPFESSAYGKPGWAAAVLWRVTRNESYLRRVEQVLDMITRKQQDDGRWLFLPEGQPPAVTLDVTAEWVHWLRVIVGEALA